jgi:hypothetical protein
MSGYLLARYGTGYVSNTRPVELPWAPQRRRTPSWLLRFLIPNLAPGEVLDWEDDPELTEFLP